MRICFTSDLHGSERLYDQLETLLRAETPDLLILGGDMHPDGEDPEPAGNQVAYVARSVLPRFEAWQTFLPDLAIAMVAGNHDWAPTERKLKRAAAPPRRVVLGLEEAWRYRGVTFVGCPFAPPSPHFLKDFERRDTALSSIVESEGAVWDDEARSPRAVEPEQWFAEQATLDTLLCDVPTPAGEWVFVSHAPPIDSALDRLANLDFPIGSQAVRRFIEERQPRVALCGHVHESPTVTGKYAQHLGRTLCINPGQTHQRLHAVLFNIEDPEGSLRHTELE